MMINLARTELRLVYNKFHNVLTPQNSKTETGRCSCLKLFSFGSILTLFMKTPKSTITPKLFSLEKKETKPIDWFNLC